MIEKIRLGIIFGGKSLEHEVSLLSARNVIRALDRNKYDVFLIGIDKEGRWHLQDEQKFLSFFDDTLKVSLDAERQGSIIHLSSDSSVVSLNGKSVLEKLDVVFPVLHGVNGEDGAVQGLLKLADTPFIGAGVLGSAIGLDKEIMKRLLRDAQIPVAKFLTYRRFSTKVTFEDCSAALGVPFFVKPSNGGSSVGVSKIHTKEEYDAKIEEAFQYDHKVMIEQYISGREIECALIGNEDLDVSVPGEVIPKGDYYSYDAKYFDENAASVEIPAKLTDEEVLKVQALAKKAYQALSCEGLARIDFFFTKEGEFIVNEINTIPGFTNMSMFPRLWAASGVGLKEIIDRLVHLALERKERENLLQSSYVSCTTVQ